MNTAKDISCTSYIPCKFGFNGKEKDDEIAGTTGAHLDFGERMYDSRIARFWSVDPKAKNYPYWSPYAFAGNNPILFIDDNGEGPKDGRAILYTTRVQIGVTKSGDIQYKYYAKWYYSNITNEMADKYKIQGGGKNGWFPITENIYKLNQKNPDKITVVNGADTPQQPIKMISKDGGSQTGSLGSPMQLEGTQSGIISFNSGGAAHTVNFVIVDANGNTISTQSQPTDGKSDIFFNVDLKQNQSFILDVEGGKVNGNTYTYGAFSKEVKSTNRAPDNMQDYGKEEPSDEDIGKK